MAKARHNRVPTETISSMELDVENFGPIAKGHVDLRPLTVFAGPSNTGKSWLATLIYVMERHRKTDSFPFIALEIRRRVVRELLDNDKKSEDMPLFPENPEKWINSLKKSRKVHLTDQEIETVSRILKSPEAELEKEFRRCYGINQSSDLIRQSHRGNSKISARLGWINHRLNLRRKVEKTFSLDIDMPKKVVLDIGQSSSEYLNELTTELDHINRYRSQENQRRLPFVDIYDLTEMVTVNLFQSQGRNNVYYLPADRGGIMHAHSVVVNALIRKASRAGLRPEKPLPTLSGVLGDFLEQLLVIGERSSRMRDQGRHRRDLITKLEKKILRGAVEVEKSETDHPLFVYRPKGWKRSLPLMNVSSMVSELAPIVLYLQYLVNPGDLIIIEEPEAHLHPAMQREFTHQIALLVQSGVQVLLTTHSEWILGEIANIVARGEMKKDNGSDEAALAKEDVGVWLFEPASKNKPMAGSKIKEASWKQDEGGYVGDFDDVAIGLNNEWADLMRHT